MSNEIRAEEATPPSQFCCATLLPIPSEPRERPVADESLLEITLGNDMGYQPLPLPVSQPPFRIHDLDDPARRPRAASAAAS
jgi:hypothetical protein